MHVHPRPSTRRPRHLSAVAQRGQNLLLPVLLMAVSLLVPACTPAPADGAAADEAAPPAGQTQPTPATPTPDAAQASLEAYQAYLGALAGALASGDPQAAQLAEHSTGAALTAARDQLAANQTEGLLALGTIQPAATLDTVTVTDGGRTVTVVDCVLNDLAHVRADNPDQAVTPASGNRQPLTATLRFTEGGWKVSETSGPELRGPLLQGESCATPQLERELLQQYEAYWDAVYAAGDPGEGQPASPDDPALAATMVDPQLADWRSALAELRDAGQVLRGRPETYPYVLGVFDYDRLAVVADCINESRGAGVYDLSSGQRVQGDDDSTRTADSTEMRLDGTTWKAANWDITEVDSSCRRPGE